MFHLGRCTGLREKLRELTNQHRRFGYRRLQILLRREGMMINRKKAQRLYKEEGLAAKRRRSRRLPVTTKARASVRALSNQRWSLGLVHDQMASSRQFLVLNMVDDMTPLVPNGYASWQARYDRQGR